MFGFVGFDIEAEKLTVFEVFLIFCMKAWAQDLVGAAGKIDTPLGFVVGWMIHVLGFVQT